MKLARRLDRIKEPQTIMMAKKSRELQAQGIDVINLSLGEPDFDVPENIKEAAYQAMKDGHSKYTPVSGISELKQAIIKKLSRDNHLNYTPDQIVVSTGAKQSLANAFLSIIDPGDDVLIPVPYWVTYKGLTRLSEGNIIEIPTSHTRGFKLSPDELEKAITPKSVAFVFSSPSNPSGTVYSRSELAALVEVFKRYPDIYIISDEIYEYINFSSRHESIAQFDEIKDRVILINGFSKGFAMTGWRLGYMAAHPSIAEACEKLQGQITSGANSVTQYAGVHALLDSLKPTEEMRNAFLQRRNYVIQALKEIPGIEIEMPDGAFYAFPNISSYFGRKGIQNANDFCMYLLNEAHVSTVDGAAFGDPNCIRISYAAGMDRLKEAMYRIKTSLEKL